MRTVDGGGESAVLLNVLLVSAGVKARCHALSNKSAPRHHNVGLTLENITVKVTQG